MSAKIFDVSWPQGHRVKVTANNIEQAKVIALHLPDRDASYALGINWSGR